MRQPRRLRGGVLVLVALVVVTLAGFHRGVPASQLHLHDGGVWVTNTKLRLAAHLNYPSRTLDGGLRAASNAFDLTQEANDVVLHGDKGGVQVIDTAQITLGPLAPLSGGAVVSQGGDHALVTNPTTGKVWALRVADLGTFSEQSPPLLKDLGQARSVVGRDGTGLVVAAEGTVRRIRAEGGSWSVTEVGRLDQLPALGTLTLTAVGDEVVALDPRGVLYTTKGRTTLPGAQTWALQLPGPAAESVVVAGGTALYDVPLGGGEARPRGRAVPAPAPGVPARPAILHDCAYGAWGSSGGYVRDCPGDDDDVATRVPALTGSSTLTFRTNRDVVVLNDTATGNVFLADANLSLVNNWADIQAQVEDKEKRDDRTQTKETVAQTRSKDNHPPVAEPDEFGVRPGRSTTLEVLDNDTDPDGDVLTATVDKAPTLGTVGPARNGRALRYATQATAGSEAFTYTANDGRGGTSSATVTVSVHPFSVNTAPRQVRVTTIALGVGASTRVNALQGWIDPDGDPVYLKSATAPTGMTVQSREDGQLTVKDLGTGTPGARRVTLVVSDGTKDTEGVLTVDVRGGDNDPPTANTDYLRVLVGRQAVVRPLANDTDPNGDVLRLASVGQVGGATIVPDLLGGSFTITAATPGSLQVPYTVTDGPHVTEGVVRVDVVADSDPNAPPVADDDLALLPYGGSVLVDVLANDVDPHGGVLVVQAVRRDATSAVSVEVVDHALLRVAAPSGLKGAATIEYVVSNGTATATGRVTVLPLPPATTSPPPVATDDTATVRAGDVVTVHVLDNDTSPGGLALTVDPTVAVNSGQGLGVAWVAQDTIRFVAAEGASGTSRLTYTVRDSSGAFASADLTLTVKPTADRNAAPRPQPVVARALAGARTPIMVPLDGIDPDGDSVTLAGIDKTPAKGTATIDGAAIVYVAPAGAVGTDSFSYQVRDRYGATASATVQVGIAPPAATNQPPVAVPDDVVARPGRLLSVPVVANDNDPDGDPLALVGGSVGPTDGTTTTPAKTAGARVELTTPTSPGTLRYYYDVTDGKGGTTRGVLTVRVDAAAPLKAPVARDDVVTSEKVAGQGSIDVPALDNDEDPDGSVGALKLTSAVGGVEVTGQRTLRIPVLADRRVVLYTVTDPDGQAASAVVIVPGSNDRSPTIKPDKVPVKVKAGEALTLRLAEYVDVRGGHTPRLTFENTVRVGPGADPAQPPVKDVTTLVYRSVKTFAGPTSVAFEVTDGDNADDPQGRRASLTLPIEVEGAGGTAPAFRPSDVQVAAGEPAKVVDLRPMVTDPDPGDLDRLTFTLGAVPAGFSAKLDGSKLSVSAPVDAKNGTAGLIPVTVTDGSTPAVAAKIPVTVTSSTRPRMTVAPIVLTDAKAGQAQQVDLTTYVTNPFAADGKPIELVGSPSVVAGQGSASASGTTVTVTPAAGYHGALTVSFRVADATHDVNRQVEGSIQATVRDKPTAPTGVTAATKESRSATVTWTMGQTNGARVSGNVVLWDGGSKDCGLATSCTVTGLTNDREYVFRVKTASDLGDSPESTPSNAVRPDVKPNVPAAPTAKWGDKKIDLTWPATATEGSAVTSYTLNISPAAPSGSSVEVPATAGTVSYTWSGLTNGTSYTFWLVAHSKAPLPSDKGPQSAPEVPAGVPGAPAAPTWSKQPVSALPPSVTVTWGQPGNTNGDTPKEYEVRRTDTGQSFPIVAATTLTATVPTTTNQISYQVRAKNKAGWGEWSAPSAVMRATSLPGPVTGLSATPTGANNQVRVTFGAAAGNGATPAEMVYQWTAKGSSGTIPAGGGLLTDGGGFPNGETVTLQVRAVSTVAGQTAQGPWTPVTVNAYGPPISPTMSCGGGYQAVSCSWSGGSDNGRPTTYTLSDAAGGNVGTSGSTAFTGIGFSAGRTLCIQAVQSTGLTGNRNCSPSASWAAPQYEVVVTSSCSKAAECRYLGLNLARWRPGSQVRCTTPGAGGIAAWTGNYGIDGNGNGSLISQPNGQLWDSAGYHFPLGVNTGDFTCTQL